MAEGCPSVEALVSYAEHPVGIVDTDIEKHIRSCPGCRRAVDSAIASGRTALGSNNFARGTAPESGDKLIAANDVRLGERYEVKQLLGRGGMGAVYLARDRTLGRDVAVKLHRAGSGSDRLQREAIAMAKLAHPNVVTVYEVASFEDRLYVAMEYVKGGTFTTWLRNGDRTWREVIEMMLSIGEGLIAAHAAELVHRDFKPENVLVGEDGRPRVGDFGIAHVAQRTSEKIIPVSTTGDSDPNTPMTMTGSVMGTPAYMAPEQIVGEAVDARADQFAFCVVAWEALYGKRPFKGSSLPAIAAAIALQKFERTTKHVPPHVIAVLERGLAHDAEERYPDMRALLDALRSTVERGRRRWRMALIASVPLAIGGTALAMYASRAAAPASDPCLGGAEQLSGAWDPAVGDKMKTAFVAARPKDGAQIYTRVAGTLDGYAKSWVDEHRDACRATRVLGAQSDSIYDLRTSCLDEKRTELAALTAGLTEAPSAGIVAAPRTVLGLSSTAACHDTKSLTAPVRPPDPAVSAQVEALKKQVAEAKAQRLLGKLKPALDLARTIAAKSTELKYRPLEAEALLVVGDLEDRMGDTTTAIKDTEQAIVAANAGNAKLTAAEAWSSMAWMLTKSDRDFDRAMLAVQMGQAAIESAGGNPMLSAELTHYEGLIYETKKKFPEAKKKYEEALAATEALHDDAKLSVILNDIGGLQRRMGDPEASRKTLQRALDIRTHLFGENHPWVFSTVLNLGNVSYTEGDYPTASKAYEHALKIAAEVFPPNHPQVALALGNLAACYTEMGRFPEAIETHKKAIAMTEALSGPTNPDVASGLQALANAYVETGDHDNAVASLERAYTIMKDHTDDPELAGILVDYGAVLISSDPKRAEQLLTQAIAMGEAESKDDPGLAYPLTVLGGLYAKTKRFPLARTTLERALALRAKGNDIEVEEIASTEFELAKVLYETPADRTRALEMAQGAQKKLEKDGYTIKKTYKDIAAWNAAHPK
ncbi:MAG TPA: tetratricopeptide repeat protein [Kofleriaceae bacterium]|jgi:tetratricopeptide (TPR) repeat protein/predicted Ser/Thr protein kinase